MSLTFTIAGRALAIRRPVFPTNKAYLFGCCRLHSFWVFRFRSWSFPQLRIRAQACICISWHLCTETHNRWCLYSCIRLGLYATVYAGSVCSAVF
nr:MAG TPA: hypothetical protein [Caudoviricetes sp.]